MLKSIITASLLYACSGTVLAQDRFTNIIEAAPESTVNSGGYVVNQRRVAIQSELTKRPPTSVELGVAVPRSSKLRIEQTARQIAQYHPHWRIYDFSINMPRSAFVEHFESRGLTMDKSANLLRFPGSKDFIDGLDGDHISGFRIWHKP